MNLTYQTQLTQQMALTLMSQEEYGTLERSKTAYENAHHEFDGCGLTRAVITEGFRSRCKCQWWTKYTDQVLE